MIVLAASSGKGKELHRFVCKKYYEVPLGTVCHQSLQNLIAVVNRVIKGTRHFTGHTSNTDCVTLTEMKKVRCNELFAI